VKAGTVVVEEGQLRRAPSGRRIHVRPRYDAAITRDLDRLFRSLCNGAFANYRGDLQTRRRR
jgi:formylmethanofuran dehydrogenase subunit A